MKAVRIDGLKVELVDVNYDLIQKEYESYTQKGKLEKATAHKELLEKLDELKAKGAPIDENTISAVAKELAEKASADIKEYKNQIKALKQKISVWETYGMTEDDEAAIIVATMSSL